LAGHIERSRLIGAKYEADSPEVSGLEGANWKWGLFYTASQEQIVCYVDIFGFSPALMVSFRSSSAPDSPILFLHRVMLEE